MELYLKIVLLVVALAGIIILSRVLKFPPSFYENQEQLKKLRHRMEKEQEDQI